MKPHCSLMRTCRPNDLAGENFVKDVLVGNLLGLIECGVHALLNRGTAEGCRAIFVAFSCIPQIVLSEYISDPPKIAVKLISLRSQFLSQFSGNACRYKKRKAITCPVPTASHPVVNCPIFTIHATCMKNRIQSEV